MNQVPNYFIPFLSFDKTPYQFMDIIGYCLYKGLKLQFSVNKSTGGYFGYFTYYDNEFVNSDCFKFFDFDEYLFPRQDDFKQYILGHKVIVSLNYKKEIGRYVLKIKKEQYDFKKKKSKWVTKEQVVSNNIKSTFKKMNHRLKNRKYNDHNENNKVLYLNRYKYG